MHFSTTFEENLAPLASFDPSSSRLDSLLHRQAADVPDKSPDERFREPSIVEIKNVLNHIVSKWILNEVERVEDDLGDELESLRGRGMVD